MLAETGGGSRCQWEERATYTQVNAMEPLAPAMLANRAILIRDDAAKVISGLRAKLAEGA